MGKSSSSLKNKHSKNSSKAKTSSRSKSKKYKSKKVRRREVSPSSSDSDDSKSMDISMSSSSEDRSRRKRDRSRTRKDVKGRKKRSRRRSCSFDSREDSLDARKRKKAKRKSKYDETKEKSRRKKRVKRDASVSSISSASNDNSEYESSRGRTEKKEKDNRRSRGRSGSAKSGRYRARSCSPCNTPRGESSYEGTEDRYVSMKISRWLPSVITVAKEEDESRELCGNETKEEIVDDLDYPCRSNDSNDGGAKRELDHHTDPAPEEELGDEDETRDINADVNVTDPKLRDMSSLRNCSGGTSESMKKETCDTSGANLNDLESILRQKALENLRKFRGEVRSTTVQASEQKNKIVSLVKQPITDKVELIQDKSNNSNVAIAKNSSKPKPVDQTSLPIERRKLVASPINNGRILNLDKGVSGSAKTQMACVLEKVIGADDRGKVVTESTKNKAENLELTLSESCHDSLQSRSSLKRTTVSGLSHEKLALEESIKKKGTFEAAHVTSHKSNDNVKNIRGLPSASSKPSIRSPKFKHNNLDKDQDDASDHSQFKSKQTSDSREPSNAKLPVSEADEERNAAKTTQSSILNIDSSGRDVDESHNAATLKSSSVENSSDKVQDESNKGSQFEQKTMTVMRGGEMVQVSYKVYIPKKTPALARRQLKR